MPPSRIGVYQFGLSCWMFPSAGCSGIVLKCLKAFETLRVLVENAGRLVTKETLLKQVWSDPQSVWSRMACTRHS
jgi:hypothetical protein